MPTKRCRRPCPRRNRREVRCESSAQALAHEESPKQTVMRRSWFSGLMTTPWPEVARHHSMTRCSPARSESFGSPLFSSDVVALMSGLDPPESHCTLPPQLRYSESSLEEEHPRGVLISLNNGRSFDGPDGPANLPRLSNQDGLLLAHDDYSAHGVAVACR